MAKDVPANPVPQLIDNPHAPDVYADRCTGAWMLSGNIRLTFEAARMNHETGVASRLVIGRLVLPLESAEGLRDFLADYLSKVKAGTVSSAGQTLN